MLLMIDNFDSFTYNLVNLLESASSDSEVVVWRNDVATLERVAELQPTGIVISPGPGRPAEAGHAPKVLEQFLGKVPILGICLGHQMILEYFRAPLEHAPVPMHGKVSAIVHTNTHEFRGLPHPLNVMRYHSLAVKTVNCPHTLQPTAWTEQGELMAFSAPELLLSGMQFHPESILTPDGPQLIQNWLAATRSPASSKPQAYAG